MSSNTGIYVLYTSGPEYRVTYTEGIDNIYGTYSEERMEWNGDYKEIVRYFDGTPMFFSLEEALDYAEVLSYNYDYIEYGICVITDFHNLNFDSLKEQYGEETEGNSG